MCLFVFPDPNNEPWRLPMTTSTKITKTTGPAIETSPTVHDRSIVNQNRGGLKLRTAVKAGGWSTYNHNRGGLKVRTAVKAGGWTVFNHNRALASAL
jgi:hypothetical protein